MAGCGGKKEAGCGARAAGWGRGNASRRVQSEMLGMTRDAQSAADDRELELGQKDSR